MCVNHHVQCAKKTQNGFFWLLFFGFVTIAEMLRFLK